MVRAPCATTVTAGEGGIGEYHSVMGATDAGKYTDE